MKIILRIVGLLLLVVLIILGVIFVPDEFMARVRNAVNTAQVFVIGEVSRRAPQVTNALSQKTQSTRDELMNLYQSFKEKSLPVIRGWISNYQPEKI